MRAATRRDPKTSAERDRENTAAVCAELTPRRTLNHS